MRFADRLIERQRRLGHPLCVGLDPHLERIPALFRSGSMAAGEPAAAEAVERFLRAVVDRVAERAVAVKPQAAFFEQLGWRGLRTLEAVVAHARKAGLPVVVDAKRGDIGSTAAAYARAFLDPEAPVAADALTLNPYLGLDSLEPFLAEVRAEVRAEIRDGGRGVFVLVRTSNPGAADLQGRELAAGGTLYEHLASLLAPLAAELRGEATGWSSLGVVVGATWPGEAERVRELLPSSLFLVPGYGAQGASAGDAVRGFVRGPGGRLEGGLVNSSRGILFPSGEPVSAAAWERAIDDALERAIDELSEAVARS